MSSNNRSESAQVHKRNRAAAARRGGELANERTNVSDKRNVLLLPQLKTPDKVPSLHQSVFATYGVHLRDWRAVKERDAHSSDSNSWMHVG